MAREVAGKWATPSLAEVLILKGALCSFIRVMFFFFFNHLFNVGLFPLPRPITDARDKLISAYI